jgi:adenylate cyclase
MRIRYRSPSGKTELWATDSESILIGRQLPLSPSYLDLRDVKVSGKHARLTFENGAYFIEDLGSTNGTWIGRKRIKDRVRLDAGTEIRLGETMLSIEGDAGPATAPVPQAAASCGLSAAPDGPPREVVDARQSLPDLFLAGASLEAARLRLESVYELCAALGEIDSFESLASALLDLVFKAFPASAKNGHGGFLLGEELALKAFRPDDQPPTCSLTLARHVRDQKKGCLWEVGTPGVIERSASLMDLGVQSAMYVPLIWKGEVLGVLYLDATSQEAAFGIDDLRLMQVMASQAAMFVKNLSLQQVIQREALVKSRLLAQFPRPIAERLARNPVQMSVVSERVEVVTVMFADVRGFTKMSAGMEPELVVQMLNDMFHDLTPIVLRLNGTVDKYMGDAILAVFGSPDPDEAQWGHAVLAALEMQGALDRLAAGRWKGRTAYRIGVGIHTGPVIHGFIGAPERMEYTVIGSTINTASRYCAAAGPGEVLISPAVYARLHQSVDAEYPPREIETKHEGMLKAYRIRGWKGPVPES